MQFRCKSFFLHLNCYKSTCFYTRFIIRHYQAACVILVFKIIPEDDPNRDRNMSELNFVI
jgi:hypothetical protein